MSHLEHSTRCHAKSFLTLFAVAGATLGASHIASAQSTQPPQQAVAMKEESPGLLARATVSPDSARRVALARVPHGRVAAAEIEEEDGKLVYSFDVEVPGRSGIEEVLIDARSGAVVSQEHEDAAQEAEERAREARASQGRVRPPTEQGRARRE